MVLIKGWDFYPNKDGVAIPWVYYNDPWDGSAVLQPLAFLKSGDMAKWTQSVVNM